jgi:hypothetical protein
MQEDKDKTMESPEYTLPSATILNVRTKSGRRVWWRRKGEEIDRNEEKFITSTEKE